MLTESDKLLQEILDYRKGKGKYNFSKLPSQKRGDACFDAWENLEYRIGNYLDSLKKDNKMENTIIEHYLKDIKELRLCLNKRFLLCVRPSTMFDECKIIEFSPSGKHTKLEYTNGHQTWKNTEDIYLVEELANLVSK
jgi:hypothetical protein